MVLRPQLASSHLGGLAGAQCRDLLFRLRGICILPSEQLVLSAENPTETLTAADSLIDQLDRSPDAAGWTEAFVTRFLELHPVELDLLKEWKTGYAVLPAWASSPHMTYQPSDNRAHCMAQWVFMKKLQALDNSVTTMNLANSSMPTLALNRAAKCRTASSGLMNTRIVGGSR